MKILFILLLAYIYYHFRKRVPILMYHRIATVKGDRNSLPVEKFEEQMQYLEEKGFHSITMIIPFFRNANLCGYVMSWHKVKKFSMR